MPLYQISFRMGLA